MLEGSLLENNLYRQTLSETKATPVVTFQDQRIY